MEHLNHPPYSPNLVPSDYFLLLHLRKRLGRQWLQNEDKLKTSLTNWINSQAEDFYADRLEKMFNHYRKCMVVEGVYVKNLSWYVVKDYCQ